MDAITLLGDEHHGAYHRPPLSKAWLKGEATAESLALRPADFYDKQRVTLRGPMKPNSNGPSWP